MSEPTTEKPAYGNWVPPRMLYITGALALVFLGLSFKLAALAVGAVLCLAAFAYLAYARHTFAAKDGRLQAQIRDLVLSHLDWNGEGNLLDIGCGNGPLTIKAAARFPSARVTGIDYWGGAWEYSQSVCRKNAELAGVAERVTFQKASASKLPFEQGVFDAAVSNLVFHEVRDAQDKRDVIQEALRVVKKGGTFAFQDLFLMKRMYGEVGDLLETIRSWGVESVQFAYTGDSDFIPRAMKIPFMVGAIGVLYGKK